MQRLITQWAQNFLDSLNNETGYKSRRGIAVLNLRFIKYKSLKAVQVVV